jgi:hypothetical protein
MLEHRTQTLITHDARTQNRDIYHGWMYAFTSITQTVKMPYNDDHVLRLLGELAQRIETTSFFTSDRSSFRLSEKNPATILVIRLNSDINPESKFLTHFFFSKCLQCPPESNSVTFTVEAASSSEMPELILHCVRPQKTNTEQHVLCKPEN